MKIVELIAGILQILTGLSMFLLALITSIFGKAFDAPDTLNVVGITAGALFFAAGVIYIVNHQKQRISLEYTGFALLAVTLTLGIAFRSEYVHLYLQAAVFLFVAAGTSIYNLRKAHA